MIIFTNILTVWQKQYIDIWGSKSNKFADLYNPDALAAVATYGSTISATDAFAPTVRVQRVPFPDAFRPS
jgi:hypothetical protein